MTLWKNAGDAGPVRHFLLANKCRGTEYSILLQKAILSITDPLSSSAMKCINFSVILWAFRLSECKFFHTSLMNLLPSTALLVAAVVVENLAQVPSQIKDMHAVTSKENSRRQGGCHFCIPRRRRSHFCPVAVNVWMRTTTQPSCHLILLHHHHQTSILWYHLNAKQVASSMSSRANNKIPMMNKPSTVSNLMQQNYLRSLLN